ncbi:hypothetical protein J6590_037463 [Homalodisca vitripennis]|nr:hypothetical protein J6590_037463 [Homalodisca vitripennis]
MDDTSSKSLPNHCQRPGRRAAFKDRIAQRSSTQATATLDSEKKDRGLASCLVVRAISHGDSSRPLFSLK